MNIKEFAREVKSLWFVITMACIVALFFISILPTSGNGIVLSSKPYLAGTIDGSQGNLIGYNITVSYHGHTYQEYILCPLYSVGSNIPSSYSSNPFWLGGFSYPASLPKGC
jgi:hypothetical protein